MIHDIKREKGRIERILSAKRSVSRRRVGAGIRQLEQQRRDLVLEIGSASPRIEMPQVQNHLAQNSAWESVRIPEDELSILLEPQESTSN